MQVNFDTKENFAELPSVCDFRIMNLTGEDVVLKNLEGVSVKFPQSGYRVSTEFTVNPAYIDSNTNLCIYHKNDAACVYFKGNSRITLAMLPNSDYYLVSNEVFMLSGRGIFCTVNDGNLLFHARHKPCIVEISPNGKIYIRDFYLPDVVIKDFRYTRVDGAHITSKLKRVESVLIRIGYYVRMVVYSAEVERFLKAAPDIKGEIDTILNEPDWTVQAENIRSYAHGARK